MKNLDSSRHPADVPPHGNDIEFCDSSIAERFVLWAVRQWHSEIDEWTASSDVRCEDSILVRGFRTAGLAEALPEFAMAMDAFLGSRRCGLEIQPPPCPHVTHDEAIVVALCGLAQGNFDRPLAASLARLLPPTRSPAAFQRLKSFTAMLDAAGLCLGPRPGEGGGRLQ